MKQPGRRYNKTFQKLINNHGLNKRKPDFTLLEFNSETEEMVFITHKINELITQEIPLKNIAIIYPEENYSQNLIAYFKLKNTPLYFKQTVNITTHPLSKKIIKLLQYAIKEIEFSGSGDAMLFEILHFDFFSINPLEIIELTRETNSKRYSSNPVSMRKLLFNKCNTPPKDLFEKGSSKALKNSSFFLENLITAVDTTTFEILLQNIFNDTLIANYIANNADKLELLQLKIAITSLVKKVAVTTPIKGSKAISSLIDQLYKGTPYSAIEIVIGKEDNVHFIDANSENKNYSHIFYAGIHNYFESNKFINNKKSASRKELLLYKNQQEKILSGFINTAYLGTAQLIVSYAKNNHTGIISDAASSIINFAQQQSLSVQKITIPENNLQEFKSINLNNSVPVITKLSEDFIAPILNKFALSVSALNSFLQCPLSFFYQYIIRIPAGKNEFMEFGSAIHYALENLFKKMQDNKQNVFPSSEIMVEDFYFYMHKNREHFTTEAFVRRLKYGTTVLINYYAENIAGWNKIVTVERNIQGVLINGVPIKGKIDKLEFNGKEINVVDYKSGNIDKALLQLKPPHNNNPNGGNYWRQAVFYKILVDNYPLKNWTVVSTEFDFVEPDKDGNYRKEKVWIEPRDIETVKQQITAVWAKIIAREFYTGCGMPGCSWCNFVKDNKLVVAM